jgi:hypothetical protein
MLSKQGGRFSVHRLVDETANKINGIGYSLPMLLIIDKQLRLTPCCR